MILMLAPGPGVTFSGMPSGTTYVADQYALIKITNNSANDQAALQTAGCFTLTPFGSWGLLAFTTLSDLYAADSGAILPGITGYPQHVVAIVTADGTSSNNGAWNKTGTGHGSGNWTQLSGFTVSDITAAVATGVAAVQAQQTTSVNAVTSAGATQIAAATAQANAAASSATAAASSASSAGSAATSAANAAIATLIASTSAIAIYGFTGSIQALAGSMAALGTNTAVWLGNSTKGGPVKWARFYVTSVGDGSISFVADASAAPTGSTGSVTFSARVDLPAGTLVKAGWAWVDLSTSGLSIPAGGNLWVVSPSTSGPNFGHVASNPGSGAPALYYIGSSGSWASGSKTYNTSAGHYTAGGFAVAEPATVVARSTLADASLIGALASQESAITTAQGGVGTGTVPVGYLLPLTSGSGAGSNNLRYIGTVPSDGTIISYNTRLSNTATVSLAILRLVDSEEPQGGLLVSNTSLTGGVSGDNRWDGLSVAVKAGDLIYGGVSSGSGAHTFTTNATNVPYYNTVPTTGTITPADGLTTQALKAWVEIQTNQPIVKQQQLSAPFLHLRSANNNAPTEWVFHPMFGDSWLAAFNNSDAPVTTVTPGVAYYTNLASTASTNIYAYYGTNPANDLEQCYAEMVNEFWGITGRGSVVGDGGISGTALTFDAVGAGGTWSDALLATAITRTKNAIASLNSGGTPVRLGPVILEPGLNEAQAIDGYVSGHTSSYSAVKAAYLTAINTIRAATGSGGFGWSNHPIGLLYCPTHHGLGISTGVAAVRQAQLEIAQATPGVRLISINAANYGSGTGALAGSGWIASDQIHPLNKGQQDLGRAFGRHNARYYLDTI